MLPFTKADITGSYLIYIAANGSTTTINAISPDGRLIPFNSTATNLVANDSNLRIDAFLRDLTSSGVQKLAGMVVSNQASAGITLTLVQTYKTELLQHRSSIGASYSRLETFMNNLRASSENYKAAESRLVDSDVATEAADSIRSRIIQQTAAALLSQANLEPQIGLRLLQNV